MKYWVEGTNHGGPHGSTTRIYLYDNLGNDLISGTTARELKRDLAAARNSSRIEVHIDSRGGSADAGYEMYSALRDCPNVVTYVDGNADSSASIVAQAGSLRYINREATMSIHRPRPMPGAVMDRQLRAGMNDLTRLLAHTYAYHSRSTLKPEQWLALMTRDTTFDAENAVRAGLADQIDPRAMLVPPMVSLHRELETAGVLR